MSGLLDGVRIVLVEPQHPGNVGAAARAMKSTGLRHLVVVDPPAFDMERARWMAPGCEDLLGAARFVHTLDEALQGVHRAVATTARHRRHRQPVLEPAEFSARVLAAPPDQVTAVLFGREDFGLSREATTRCDSLLRIPTLEHASLNLAQAVLIIAWSLFEEARRKGLDAQGRVVGGHVRKPTATLERPDRRDGRADLPMLEPAVEELIGLLDRVGYTRAAGPEKVGVTARSALQRAGLSQREVEAIRGMVSRVDWALDHPEVDWTKTRKS
jgi:tRNA (cytidine32/uridine32-2'-O)-methyltransferase